VYLSHFSSTLQATVGVLRCLRMGKTSNKKSKALKFKNRRLCSSKYWGKVNILVLTIAVSLFVIDGHYLVWMRLTQNKIANKGNIINLLNELFFSKLP